MGLSYSEVQKQLSELDSIDCLVLRKKKKDRLFGQMNLTHEYPSYFIKGTRVSLMIYGAPIYANNVDGSLYNLFFKWSIKKKHKNKFTSIKFEDILELDFVSNKAKSELLFHLDLFSGRK